MQNWSLQLVYSPTGLVVRTIVYASHATAKIASKRAMAWLCDEYFHAVIVPPKAPPSTSSGDSNG